jgi:hypothetical protein
MKTLFKEWSAARPHYKFATDGILDPSAWSRQLPKIAFLLKESHSGWIPASGRILIAGSASKFWWNIVRWKFTIVHTFNHGSPHLPFPSPFDVPEVKENKGELNAIAYINIKKNDQDRKNSSDRDIRRYACDDSGFLRAQIAHVLPDIILCGGTFKFYRDIFPDVSLVGIGDRVYRHDAIILIDFFHPGYWQCPGGQFELYGRLNQVLAQESVCAAIQEMRASHATLPE